MAPVCEIKDCIFPRRVLQRNIRGIRDFVSMRDEDRMTMLRNLSGGEYQDIINVCASMPNIVMQHSVSGKAAFCVGYDSILCWVRQHSVLGTTAFRVW